MSRTAAATLFACIGLVGVVAVAALTVFLFRGSESLPPPGTDAGIAIDPSATDPAGVAASVMSGVFTWQPAVQDSPWEALHSQQGSLAGQMATAAAAPPSPLPQAMPEWSAWSRSGDVVTAVTKLDGEPTIESDTATVPVIISQTVQHISGEITPYTTYTATVVLEKQSDAWQVANYRLGNSSR